MRDGEMRRTEGENGANIMKRATEERSEVSQRRVMNHISIFLSLSLSFSPLMVLMFKRYSVQICSGTVAAVRTPALVGVQRPTV